MRGINVTDEQNQMIMTIKKIAAMIEQEQLSMGDCPVSDITEALHYALNYRDNAPLSEDISLQYGDLIKYMIANGQKAECCYMLDMMADWIRYEYEKDSYNDKKYSDISKQLEDAKEDNRLFDNIVQRYKSHSMDDAFLGEHTYHTLALVKEKGSIELFKEISSCVYDTNLRRIARQNKKKIAFFVKDSAEWSCEEVYKLYAARPDCEVVVTVAPFFVGTQQTILDTYNNTIAYFAERGFNTIGLYDQYQDSIKSWKEVGSPDIVFHLNPYYTAFIGSSSILNFPLSILNVYIPYGMMIYGNVSGQFNQLSHALYWKIFCETACHKEMAEKYSDIGDFNVVSSGFVRMDSFYRDEPEPERDIWKMAPDADKQNVKRIIYAPHWSIRDGAAGFGNFDKTYMQMYNYAKDTATATSWVLRPHPMLRAGSVAQGLFQSEQEYDEYLDMWNRLPNAKVIESGTYCDIFKSSDAMILDSISFLGEYLYVHKPMLFLTRERNTFNDFGRELAKILYKADGGDFNAIKRFVENTVIQNDDYMLKEREAFFEKYLDYYKINGMPASEYIYEYIDDAINKVQ